MIKKLTEREHILQRPAMYIGAVDLTKTSDYILEDDKITYKEIEYVPGLIKIINEIIDNSVDVAIKTNFKDCTEIKVNMREKNVTVEDDGPGIPIIKNEQGHWFPELCWGHARAGSNFDDDANRTQIGMNGVGGFATNCFSKQFVGATDDGTQQYTIKFKNNGESFVESFNKSKGSSGTLVSFYPDLERFGLTEIDQVHMDVIKQRLINLSMSFPEITFKFNGKKINTGSFKKYVSLFSNTSEIIETEKYRIAIIPNENDDFRQFSYVNGLKIPDGGTHIDMIVNPIVNGIREKLVKKFKTIKPGDIKNKLMMIAFLKDLPNPKFNSQSKEKITNSTKEIQDYYNLDLEKTIAKILKTKEIIDPITEVYRIKEEFKRRQELKGLNKTVKKIKSEKYLPATEHKKYLLLVEGESALGGLMPVLGRKDIGYYTLKGKPLNAYSADQKKFTQNKELSELYQVIQNEGYSKIIFATDQDLDGIHIRGLLIGFFHKYLPELKGNIGALNTPVIAVKKGKDLQRWYYNLNDEVKINKGETSKYYKGLGSHKEVDLKYIVQTDGLDKMIDMFEFDNEESIDDWLGDSKADVRKEHIQNNEFSIASL